MVSTFIDILIARRLWNFRSISYSTMQYTMFNVIKEIRRKSVPDLATLLMQKLNEETVTFANNNALRLHQQNRLYIHYLPNKNHGFC